MVNSNNIGYFPQMPICDKHFFADLNSDFSLPDYQSEIKRLLSSKVFIVPQNEYLGNANASLMGEVQYHILYLGADNNLYSAKLTDNYKIEVPFEFNSHCVDIENVSLFSYFNTESLNVRVLGPRKLNIKSKIKARALANTPCMYSALNGEIEMKTNIEKNILETPCMLAKKCSSDVQSIKEFIPMENSNDTLRIIEANPIISVSQCSASQGKINVNGEAILKLLYCNDIESDLPLTYIKKLPFSCTIDCDELDSTFECCANGYVCDSTIEVSEQGINVGISYTISACGQKNTSVHYLFDAYSTQHTSEGKTEGLSFLCANRSFNGSLTQNDSFMLSDVKMPKDAKIINADARANVLELCFENGKSHLKGECLYQVTYFYDGEYALASANAPFKYEIELHNAQNEQKLHFGACANPVFVRSRCDGERLFVDCELNLNLFLQNESHIEILKEFSIGEKCAVHSNEIVLCYPEKDATIWQIGKHYKQSIKKIKSQNGLNENDLVPKTKFIVV